MNKRGPTDKKRFLRAIDHLTVPPRLEGKVKNAMMNPIRKRKRSAARKRAAPGQ